MSPFEPRKFGLMLAASLVFPSFAAVAQTYPPLPDQTTTSTGTPYPTQGPLPSDQQANPYLTPGMPHEAAPGVPNGMSTRPVPPLRNPGLGVVAPPPPPNDTASPSPTSPQRLTPMGTMPLYVDPDTLDFQPVPGLPPGTEMATVKELPGGGRELYLRLPAMGEVPPLWLAHPAELTFLRGRVTVRRPGPAGPQPGAAGQSWFIAEPGGHFAMPSRAAYAFRCQSGESCLLLVHASGPFEPHLQGQQPVPPPAPLP